MLAKKLLSIAQSGNRKSDKRFCEAVRGTKAHGLARRRKYFWGEDPLFGRRVGEYNKKNYFGFEKFSLEEKEFVPIIILESEARHAH
jgi:hypothetical protein